MSLAIAGMGWVTPLGNGVDPVWDRLLHGDEASATAISEKFGDRSYSAFRVPESALTGSTHPRLRRASVISRFAAAAGLEALQAAGLKVDSQNAGRIALIFAISNGGVIYTKRFYRDVVEMGAQSASPLLFPETVFNAPASHLAAILEVSGASYTVVGDGAVGILALKLAEDLLASGDIDACLAVAAEEIDSLVCEAYRQWRFLRDPKKPETGRGMIMSEGAGAVLLKRSEGEMEIDQIVPGANFFRRSEASARLGGVASRLKNKIGFCVGSGNGTFIDRAERAAVGDEMPVYSPKIALGESVGASVFWQLITAAKALEAGTLPGSSKPPVDSRAVVLACGLNQQTGGLTLRRRDCPAFQGST